MRCRTTQALRRRSGESARRRRSVGVGAAAGAVLLPVMTLAPPAPAAAGVDADPRGTYRSLDPSPIVVEGGVLMLPFEADGGVDLSGSSSAPPAKVRIELEDGRILPATVGWIAPSASIAEPPPAWTESAEPLTIVATPSTPPLRPPLLLAEMPDGYRGTLALLDADGRRSAAVSPRWLDAAPPAAVRATSLPSLGAWASPDPRHPLEHFRTVLLADRYGAPPPPPPGDEAGRLAAVHLAELWRAALHRVEGASRGVAAEIRERLTATCTAAGPGGEAREVAAWFTDPVAQRRLLALLLDESRDDRETMQAALAWIRARPATTLWISASLGDSVSFEVANPGVETIVLRCWWIEGDPIPSGVAVPPRSVQRFTLRRPPRKDPLLRGDADGILVVEFPGGSARLDFGPSPQAIRPPALPLGALRPPRSLAAAQLGTGTLPPADRRAFAELRRRDGRWELFVECFRPSAEWRDRLELRLGEAASPAATLSIGEQGPVDAGAAVVHRRSHADRWRCRIELPDAWLAESLVGLEAPAVGIALERILEPPGGGPPLRQSLGPPPPPWRSEPATIAVDPSTWPAGPR
jgi:hypothetical protein